MTAYNRAGVILWATENLQKKRAEEFTVVGLVCAVFLLSQPLVYFSAFIDMKLQGVNVGITSLMGIAIAIRPMVDAETELTG